MSIQPSIPRSFLHALPDACDIDVSQIRGNLSDHEKRLGANLFAYCIKGSDTYGADVGRRLRFVEMNIWGRDAQGAAAQGQTVFEIDVERDMCNSIGTLHGACAAYIVGPCSDSSLVVLGATLGIDGTGVSQSLHMTWHQPAKVGAKLRVLSNSTYMNGRIRTARCEIWDRERDKLYVSATHTTVNNAQPKL